MSLPFFYINQYDSTQKEIVLDEDTSRHVVQVLRMKAGEQLNLTDGRGSVLTCTVAEEHKKHCRVVIGTVVFKEQTSQKTIVAMSLLKNVNRFEWFLEKATELGIHGIIPLICERTEKEKFRYDRMQGICISAMLQSQQCWLPVLHEPIEFGNLEMGEFGNGLKMIAHCYDGEKQLLKDAVAYDSSALICIGPEGDFTPAEVALALERGFKAVSLGSTRLRTETAGVAAAVMLTLS